MGVIDIWKEVNQIETLILTKPTNLANIYRKYDTYIIYDWDSKETHVVPSTRLTGYKGCFRWRGDYFDYFKIAEYDNILERIYQKIKEIINKLTEYDIDDCVLRTYIDKEVIEFIKSLCETLSYIRMHFFAKLCLPYNKIDTEPNSGLSTQTFADSEEEMFAIVVLGRLLVIHHCLRRYFEGIQMNRYVEYEDVKELIEEKIKKSLNPDYTQDDLDEKQLRIDKEIFSLKEELDDAFYTYTNDYEHYEQQELGLPIDPPQPQPNPPTIPQDPPQTKTTTQQDPSQPEPQPQPTKEYPCIYRVHTDNYTLLLQDLKTAKIITEQNNKYKWNLTQKLFTYFCHTLRENKWLEVNRQNGIPWTKIASYYDVNNERLSTTLGEIIDNKTKKLKKISSLNSDKNKEVLDKVLEKYLNLDIL